MSRIRNSIDRLSWRWLLLLSPFVLLAPWPAAPEPHLVEKLRFLSEGDLTRPIDIFDLFYHGFPAILLILKSLASATRHISTRKTSSS